MINTDQFTDLVNCTRLSWIVIPTNQAVGIEKPYRKEAFLSLGFSLRFLEVKKSWVSRGREKEHRKTQQIILEVKSAWLWGDGSLLDSHLHYWIKSDTIHKNENMKVEFSLGQKSHVKSWSWEKSVLTKSAYGIPQCLLSGNYGLE